MLILLKLRKTEFMTKSVMATEVFYIKYFNVLQLTHNSKLT